MYTKVKGVIDNEIIHIVYYGQRCRFIIEVQVSTIIGASLVLELQLQTAVKVFFR